jgi:hypothetical protein
MREQQILINRKIKLWKIKKDEAADIEKAKKQELQKKDASIY